MFMRIEHEGLIRLMQFYSNFILKTSTLVNVMALIVNFQQFASKIPLFVVLCLCLCILLIIIYIVHICIVVHGSSLRKTGSDGCLYAVESVLKTLILLSPSTDSS